MISSTSWIFLDKTESITYQGRNEIFVKSYPNYPLREMPVSTDWFCLQKYLFFSQLRSLHWLIFMQAIITNFQFKSAEIDLSLNFTRYSTTIFAHAFLVRYALLTPLFYVRWFSLDTRFHYSHSFFTTFNTWDFFSFPDLLVYEVTKEF